jgi:hypothetical protein
MEQNKTAAFFLDSALGFGSETAGKGEKLATNRKINLRPILFSHGKRTDCFFTEDSKLYLNPQSSTKLKLRDNFDSPQKQFDGLGSRFVNNYMKYRPHKKKSSLAVFYTNKTVWIKENIGEVKFQTLEFWNSLTFAKAWNLSLVGAVIVGMISMSFIYRYLGPGALADSKNEDKNNKEIALSLEKAYPQSKVLGAEDVKEKVKNGIYFESVLNSLIDSKKEESEQKIREMVKGYPIEEMVPYIADQDPIVAAFLVAIARKESTWGVHSPVLNGQDCYNYWGYRGIRKLMGTGGHTCFNSREDAVETVAKRIAFLVSNKKLNTPAKMIIWKCGSDCEAAGGQAAANKWIDDVDYYFKKLNDV